MTPRESGIRKAEEVAKKLNRRFGVTSKEHINAEMYPAALGMKVVTESSTAPRLGSALVESR